MAQIVLGNGSNDVLNAAARAFLTPSSEAVYSQHAFAIYALEIQYTGAAGVEAPAREFGHDLTAMLAAVTARTRMIFIANPNNPTGTLAGAAELHGFLRKVPPQIIVVLDEAYSEYIPDALKSDSLAWLGEFPNLIVTRTFSKAYGLAGLRVGYAFAHPDVADLMNRVRQPFNVNSIALAAATAALDDMEFVARSYAENLRGLKRLEEGAQALGLDYIASHANFLTLRVGKAAEVYKRLLRRGVIVRPIGGGYGLPEHLRVTVGTAEENERFLAALAASLKE
jgi:histidinol-phosphate aminotransferase